MNIDAIGFRMDPLPLLKIDHGNCSLSCRDWLPCLSNRMISTPAFELLFRQLLPRLRSGKQSLLHLGIIGSAGQLQTFQTPLAISFGDVDHDIPHDRQYAFERHGRIMKSMRRLCAGNATNHSAVTLSHHQSAVAGNGVEKTETHVERGRRRSFATSPKSTANMPSFSG
jgi:hypothetical protein